MYLFKKFAGRRNMVAAAVVAENTSHQYNQRDEKIKNNNISTPDDPFSYRPSETFVTTTSFDCDEKFMIVAQVLIFRHEKEGLSPKDAINATLTTLQEKRDFLEALDLKHATIQCQQHQDSVNEDSPVDKIVIKTRSTFVDELKSVWRDSVLSSSTNNEKQHPNPSKGSRPTVMIKKTASSKHNFGFHSPIKPIKSPEKMIVSTRPRSSKHRRQRLFFPVDFDQQQQPYRRSSAIPIPIRLDFKLSSGAQPVQSLRLDGVPQSQSSPALDAYAPPSPIVTH